MTRFTRQEGPTILGWGRALPPREVDNAGVLAHGRGLPEPIEPEVLAKTLGVERRYWTHAVGSPADHGELTSQDLAIEAAARALAHSGLAPEAIDGLVMVTTSAPRASVNTGNHVARALGLSGFSMEIKAGCAGSLYGLTTVAALSALGARRILLVAAEAWTKLMPPELPGPMAVAGDGAVALVVGPGEGAYLGGAMLTRPEHASAMMPPGLYPPTPEAIARGDYQLRLSEDVAELIRDLYPLVFAEALAAADLTIEALDCFIPHQASLPIIRRALRDCGVPAEKAFHTLARYGNASSASVLLSLHDALEEGRLKRGDTLGLAAVGGGVTAASVLLRI